MSDPHDTLHGLVGVIGAFDSHVMTSYINDCPKEQEIMQLCNKFMKI